MSLLDLTDDKSTLVQVMAWCRQATAITSANVDTDLCGHIASLGHNEFTHYGLVSPQNMVTIALDNGL